MTTIPARLPDSPPVDRISAKEHQRLQEAVADFEAIFVRQMLGEMRKTIPEPKDGELFKQGMGEKVFQEMLDSQYADIMSRRPGGLGLKEDLYRHLTSQGAAGGDAAAGVEKVKADTNSFNALKDKPIR
ncbi:MAG: rod-binding protein [Magnetococcales bacterium]|nr:rod-binding protein [Magnetococcales bacterium]